MTLDVPHPSSLTLSERLEECSVYDGQPVGQQHCLHPWRAAVLTSEPRVLLFLLSHPGNPVLMVGSTKGSWYGAQSGA